jgi:hypothetical protein
MFCTCHISNVSCIARWGMQYWGMRRATYDPECLRRELFDRSAVLTRAAYALELAAGQLREAPSYGSCAESSVYIRSAAMTALQGAFGAFQVSAAYELAAFMESITEESGASD